MKRMWAVVAVVGGLALVAVGCGDSGGSGTGKTSDTGAVGNDDTTVAPTGDTTTPPPGDATEPPADTTVAEDTAAEDDKGVTPPPDVPKPPPEDVGGEEKIDTCAEAYPCFVNCYNAGGSQTECLGKCAGDLPKAEQKPFENYLVCPGQNCADVPAKEQVACIFDKCFDEFHACMVIDEGSENCGFIITCSNACQTEADPQGCTFACLKQATKEAVKIQLTATGCVVTECGNPPSQSCALEAQGGACKDLVDACLNDGKAPPAADQ